MLRQDREQDAEGRQIYYKLMGILTGDSGQCPKRSLKRKALSKVRVDDGRKDNGANLYVEVVCSIPHASGAEFSEEHLTAQVKNKAIVK